MSSSNTEKISEEQCSKWQNTFLTIDCDKLDKKKKDAYFKTKCDRSLFLCGESSKCPNSTSPLQDYLFGHYEEDCFNATTEKQDEIKAQIMENYGVCQQFNASTLAPCRSNAAEFTTVPFFMILFLLLFFK